MNNIQILHLAKIKTLFFVFAFTALAVLTPLAAHYFGGPLAGRMFLPMHIFVLVAGLVLGWRAGLFVGVLTPLISYSLTHLPPATVLPFVAIEMAAYGLLAGLLRKNFKLNIWWALLGAMAFGRAAAWLAVLIWPTKIAAGQYIFGAVLDGWRGILLQILLVPVLMKAIGRFLGDEKNGETN